MQGIDLRNCDYKELAKEMKKENVKVDCILTDPPYNISRQNNFKTINRSGIDFGAWDYNFNQSEWIKNCVPLLKDGGSIIIFNDWKIYLSLCNLWRKMPVSLKIYSAGKN